MGLLIFSACAVALLALSALLSAVVWRTKGGPVSEGIHLGLTQPVLGVFMAIWLTVETEETEGDPGALAAPQSP